MIAAERVKSNNPFGTRGPARFSICLASSRDPRNGLRGDLLEADLWPGITSGLPFAQNRKVMPDIESKPNLLMVSFARRGDAAEFVDGVEQGNESFIFRLSVFLALWTISHCEALAIGFKIEVPRWMTVFTSLLLPYRPPRCTCRISR